jgi:hypothetical protein
MNITYLMLSCEKHFHIASKRRVAPVSGMPTMLALQVLDPVFDDLFARRPTDDREHGSRYGRIAIGAGHAPLHDGNGAFRRAAGPALTDRARFALNFHAKVSLCIQLTGPWWSYAAAHTRRWHEPCRVCSCTRAY